MAWIPFRNFILKVLPEIIRHLLKTSFREVAAAIVAERKLEAKERLGDGKAASAVFSSAVSPVRGRDEGRIRLLR